MMHSQRDRLRLQSAPAERFAANAIPSNRPLRIQAQAPSRPVKQVPSESRRRTRLTPRETEIVALVAQGRNGPAIMAELFIAEGTLKAHMSHIYEKCGVANRRELKELLEG